MLQHSIRGRILIFGVGCGLLSSIGICLAASAFAAGPVGLHPALIFSGVACSLLALLLMALLLVRTALTVARGERARHIVEERAQAVDLLLDFSQTIQGAAQTDQILATLGQALRKALSLAGVVILAHEPDGIPSTCLKSVVPADLVNATSACVEFDPAMCPCMRQKQSRLFVADGSPVRCSVDAMLKLAATHPAFCVPMQVGPKVQVAVHLLLPPTESWTDAARQLAQTYVNTAQSTMISLHLLSDAEQRSMTDPLTGLYNRRSMEQLLQREVALSDRYQHPLSLVMIDLDRFKLVNDDHGHAAGDHLLRSFADCVRMTLRKTDLAFRYGGDEFVVVLPQTPISQAQQVVHKLRQAFASVDFSSAIARMEQQPTLSIGLVERSVAHHLLTLQSLLAAADQALYEAKQDNRNCVHVYQPPRAA